MPLMFHELQGGFMRVGKFGWMFLCFIATAAQAAVPVSFTYQGSLKQNGTPVNSACSIELRLTNADGTQTYWTTGAQSVQVKDGLYRVELLPTGVDWAALDPYIETRVAGTLLLPREKMTSAPYALMARELSAGATAPYALMAKELSSGATASYALRAKELAPGATAAYSLAAAYAMTASTLTANANVAGNISIAGHTKTSGRIYPDTEMDGWGGLGKAMGASSGTTPLSFVISGGGLLMVYSVRTGTWHNEKLWFIGASSTDSQAALLANVGSGGDPDFTLSIRPNYGPSWSHTVTITPAGSLQYFAAFWLKIY